MSKLFIKGIDPELEEQLRRFCEENNLTLKEAIEQAIRLLLDSGRGRTSGLRAILTKWAGNCSICKSPIAPGEIAYWDSNDKRLVCISCFSQAHSELKDAKRLYELYKAVRRLKALKRIAEAELEELMRKVDVYERVDRLYELTNNLSHFIATLNSYINNVEPQNADLKAIAASLSQINEKLDEYLATHSLTVRKTVKKVLEKEV